MQIKLGDWFLNTQTGVLSKDIDSTIDDSKKLDHTPLALLLCLYKYKGQDVSKDTMLAEVWPNKVVSEDVLSVAMSQIRKALGDNARKPQYVKTISGIGYRLIASVEEAHNVEKLTQFSVIKGNKKKVAFILFSLLLLLTSISYLSYLQLKADPSLQQLPTASAQNNYQKARYLLTTTDRKNWLEAKQIFEDTIISSPEFAPVYRELAQVKLQLIGRDNLAAFKAVEELKFLLNKSLFLSANNQESYLLLARIAFTIEWDFVLAEQYFTKALKIDNENADAHFQFSRFLMAIGKFDLSLKHIQEYMVLDPAGYAAPMVAWIYNMMGEYELALAEMDKLEKLNSEDLMYLMSSQAILENTGREEQSFLKLIKIFKQSDYTENDIMAATLAFEQGGLASVNQWLLEVKKEQGNIGQGYPPLSFARYAATAGKKDLAIKYILQAREKRIINLLFFNVDPKYKAIRQAPELNSLFNFN